MSAHTPAPWRWLEAEDASDVRHAKPMTICDAASNDLATVYSREWATVSISGEEAEANARLIASAPDLLAQLQVMLRRYIILAGSGDCGNWNPEEEPEVIAARAVVIAATGETP